MKYTACKPYFSDFSTIKVNALRGRSYFIPFETKEESDKYNLLEKRYSSSKVLVLNGEWDFKYYANPNEMPLSFDTDSIKFDKISVPSCWQYKGYDRVAYINARWPFAFRAPKIPTKKPVGKVLHFDLGRMWYTKANEGEYNSIGMYRTFFDCKDFDKKYILSFLGVCSCMELYINGAFVGYSEESHITAEFDITKYVKEHNEMVVIVHKWCNGTYLECQDMFRNNGIFRDVLLRIDNKTDIFDLDFDYEKVDGVYNCKLVVELNSDVETEAVIELTGPGVLCKKKVNVKNKGVIELNSLKPIEWNAEKPTLYDLYISIPGSTIHTRVAFKNIQIIKDVYYLNGEKIKIRGVNHHDTSPTNGYYMTPTEIYNDLKLCKDFNMNLVRTSHYQPDPLLLELAAEMGLYICDECDLETHGTRLMVIPFSFNKLSNNKKWMKHYVDRMERQYNRDKLIKAPIIMWSLGNESGDGCNTLAMYNYIKSVSNIPVQYESAIYGKAQAYDIASEMYPTFKMVDDVGNHRARLPKLNDRPYWLCEFAHAMGVGPGNIEEYMDLFYKYDNVMGGAVWEMIDHSILEDGVYKYGGDHGEWMHDSNFCCDGLFYPDRKPSTGAYIVKHAYSPIRIKRLNNREIEVFNTLAFTNSNEYEISYTQGENKKILETNIPPFSKQIINLEFEYVPGDSFVNFEIRKDGFLVDEFQITLGEEIKPQFEMANLPSWFTLEDGMPNINKDGVKLSVSNPYNILWRANTDNDKSNFFYTTMPKWYGETEEVIGTIVDTSYAKAIYKVIANNNEFVVTDIYQGVKDGVLVTTEIEPVNVVGNLPRFGKAFKLDESFNTVTWYGRRDESYLDMKEQTIIGKYTKAVKEMTEPNIKPQESGNRCDTRFASVTDGKNVFTFKAVSKAFELGIKPYSDLELSKMKHTSDEVTTGTYVTISAFQMGIGTGSCGPETKQEYCYDANHKYKMEFIITLGDK